MEELIKNSTTADGFRLMTNYPVIISVLVLWSQLTVLADCDYGQEEVLMDSFPFRKPRENILPTNDTVRIRISRYSFTSPLFNAELIDKYGQLVGK